MADQNINHLITDSQSVQMIVSNFQSLRHIAQNWNFLSGICTVFVHVYMYSIHVISIHMVHIYRICVRSSVLRIPLYNQNYLSS